MSFEGSDEGDGDGELGLARLIDRALARADELDLALVALRLDEARLALGITKDNPTAFPWLTDPGESIKAFARSPGRRNVITLRPLASLERLLGEHELLDTMRKSLMNLVEGPPAPLEAERQLIEFCRMMEPHRALERSCVYGPLLTAGICDDPGLGIDLRDLVGEIESDWSGYLHKWNRENIAANWPAFGLETMGILTRAGERLRLENQIIYPLAFKHGVIELRSGTG